MAAAKIVVLGTGGLGRETLWGASAMPGVEALGFLTMEREQHGTDIAGAPVLGDEDWLGAHPEVGVVCAIGDPRKRRQVVRRLASSGALFGRVIHPAATVSEQSAVGRGCIIGAAAVITTQATLGAHVVVGVGAIVSHDAVLEDFATLSPGSTLAGFARVGEAAEVGPGATVARSASLERGALLGANSLVLGQVAANSVAVGSPAREIRRFEGDDAL